MILVFDKISSIKWYEHILLLFFKKKSWTGEAYTFIYKLISKKIYILKVIKKEDETS